MATIEELEGLFDDHPSLEASLQDFEGGSSSEINQSPRFGYPSHHSGFRSDTDSEMADSMSNGRFSPPAWRVDAKGNRSSGFWNRPILGKRSRDSRDSSPEYESADDGYDATLAAAVNTRLPTGSLSPEKRRSPSPDPYPAGGDFGKTFGAVIKKEEGQDVVMPSTENPNNCMVFPQTNMNSTDYPKTFVSLSEQKYSIALNPLKPHSRSSDASSTMLQDHGPLYLRTDC
jgi:hypothetical protein